MNSRRQTLAAMSPAALNSRASLGPARIAKDVKGAAKALAPAAAPPPAAGVRPPANNAPARAAPGAGVQRRRALQHVVHAAELCRSCAAQRAPPVQRAPPSAFWAVMLRPCRHDTGPCAQRASCAAPEAPLCVHPRRHLRERRGGRSSTYAKPGGPRSDPRPVSDKAYQANCIRVLIAYLSTHGYDQPLAPKLLASPMSKDVTHIVQFLMRQVRAPVPGPQGAPVGPARPHIPLSARAAARRAPELGAQRGGRSKRTPAVWLLQSGSVVCLPLKLLLLGSSLAQTHTGAAARAAQVDPNLTHPNLVDPTQALPRTAQVDPNLAAKSLGKIEDDVPALFKRLRYPFGISKSSLFAVGSPHTWPSLLAALTWLAELLNYEEKAVRGPARARFPRTARALRSGKEAAAGPPQGAGWVAHHRARLRAVAGAGRPFLPQRTARAWPHPGRAPRAVGGLASARLCRAFGRARTAASPRLPDHAPGTEAALAGQPRHCAAADPRAARGRTTHGARPTDGRRARGAAGGRARGGL